MFLTFTVGPLIEDVVFILWTLLGQRRLLEAFDLVDVLCEAVLAMFFVHFPLHLNLTEPGIAEYRVISLTGPLVQHRNGKRAN